MISLTPTGLRDYLICPHLYEAKHLRRAVRFADSPAAAFGRSIHKVLEDLHRPADTTYSPPCAAEVDALLVRHWDARCYDPTESAAYFASARDALLRYTDAVGVGRRDETLGVEVYMRRIFASDDLRVRLGCKADRIGVRDGRTLVVEDYKTSASGKVPTRESLACDLPTFLYYVLARVTYPEYDEVVITFVNVLSLARVEIVYDTELVTLNKNRLRECFTQVATRHFAPRRCEACAWCEASGTCPLYAGAEIDFARVR